METLPPGKAARKSVEREALAEKEVERRLELTAREVMDGAKRGRCRVKFAAVVITSIASSWCCLRRRGLIRT